MLKYILKAHNAKTVKRGSKRDLQPPEATKKQQVQGAQERPRMLTAPRGQRGSPLVPSITQTAKT